MSVSIEQPKVFFHCKDNELLKTLRAVPAIASCIHVFSSQEGDWLEEFEDIDCDIALIYADIENERDLAQFEPGSGVEVMIFSDGKPSERIDSFMQRVPGYHFRAPFNEAMVVESLTEAVEDFSQNGISRTKALTSDLDQFGQLVGSSKVMRKLYRSIRRVAATDANVLIIGERGTGKELVANTIHMMSPRSNQAIVALNCGALSPELIDSELFGHIKGAFTGAHRDHKGVFEQAENGTLFLDEVTEMPMELQVKLLRVLEQGEYKPVGSETIKHTNVRVVAASNRNPFEAIEQGLFREDLYFRLAQFPLTVPALNERDGDIEGLVKHFVAYLNRQEQQNMQISTDALKKISIYRWPGNVRELKHCIERAYLLAETVIEPSHIQGLQPDSDKNTLDGDIPIGVPLEAIEKIAIEKTLEDNEGNKTETADQLGISVKTLYNKLEKYDQEPSGE